MPSKTASNSGQAPDVSETGQPLDKQSDAETNDNSSRHPGEPAAERPAEIGGPKGPEPTRYGDWEVKGRCSDF